jgi:hypothetical protein
MRFRRAPRSLIAELSDAEQPFWRAAGDGLATAAAHELPAVEFS